MFIHCKEPFSQTDLFMYMYVCMCIYIYIYYIYIYIYIYIHIYTVFEKSCESVLGDLDKFLHANYYIN